jgi:competence/damage-inducible protein CinA-like protein
MPTAEILTIGTEILLGEIVDTNAPYIARVLRDLGIDLYRKTTVGDNTGRIALAIRQALERADIIITTGGLGPTVDDPTREAVAEAIGVETVFRPELWEQIQARFRRFRRQPTENNRRQAYVPSGAIPIENPVGTAPAFVVEYNHKLIFSLPGVPREMEYLMENAVTPYLREHFNLHGMIKSRILHTAGAGESQIDTLIEDLEKYSNPTVGLAAHAGQVDVRITAKAASPEEAEQMIAEIETVLRQRIGEWIYGTDEETLERAALTNVTRLGWKLGVIEAGLNGGLIRSLARSQSSSFAGGEMLSDLPEPDGLLAQAQNFSRTREANVVLAAALQPGEERQDLHLALVSPAGEKTLHLSYGGPPLMAPQWAVNVSLDLIRRMQDTL